MPRPPISVEKIQTIIEETQNDRSRPDIAEKVNLSEKTVYKYQRLYELL